MAWQPPPEAQCSPGRGRRDAQKTPSGSGSDHRTRASWEANTGHNHGGNPRDASSYDLFLISPLHIKYPKLPAHGSTLIWAERQPDILVDVSRHCELLITFLSLAFGVVSGVVHVGGCLRNSCCIDRCTSGEAEGPDHFTRSYQFRSLCGLIISGRLC